MESLQEFIILLGSFINNVIMPFLFGLALLFFLWNAFRFFILEADDKGGHDNAKQLMLYGIGGFVLLVSVWGIVNLLVNGLGIGGEAPLRPDYVDTDGFLRENLNQREYCQDNPMSIDCR